MARWSSPCDAADTLAWIVADSCAADSLALALYPGTYYIVIAPAVFSGVDCGRDYVAGVTCVPWQPPVGRCCYGDPAAPVCTENYEPDCRVLEGVWNAGLDCATLCPPRPGCPENTLRQQPAALPADIWAPVVSDRDAPGGLAVCDNYTVTQPIGRLRVWGFMLDLPGGTANCVEDPLPFIVSFRADSAGWPGSPVATCTTAAPGTDGDSYGSLTRYQFDLTLTPPCTLRTGWVSVEGAGGNPACGFAWLTSPVGDGHAWQWQGTAFASLETDLSYCLAAGECAAPPGLIARLAPEDPALVELQFIAPAGGDYDIYSTTDRNNDGDPRDNDPQWTLVASLMVSAPGTQAWTDPAPLVAYRNYVVVRRCDGILPADR